MEFTYTGKNKQGKSVKGIIEAQDSNAASTALMAKDIFPLSIIVAKGKSKNGSTGQSVDFSAIKKSSLFKKKFKVDDLVLFARQLYSLTRAGVPLTQAIGNLERSYTDKPQLQEVLREVTNDLELGRPLGATLQRFPDIFPQLFVNIIKVGETTGNLDVALHQLSDYLEQDLENRRQIKQAMRYPMFVTIAMVIAIGVINVMIIPAFAGVFEKMGSDLPIQTKILVGLSEFTSAYWPYIGALIFGGFFGYKHWTKTTIGHLWHDQTVLKLPLLGSINRKGTLCRFCRSLGLALQSGVPLLQALQVVSGSLDNCYLEARIDGMRDRIENGESMLRASKSAELFTPLILQMISVGEDTGQLDGMLLEAADHYDGEVKYELKNLGSNIEPVLIMTMGAMVLILALGVFLPVWEMTTKA